MLFETLLAQILAQSLAPSLPAQVSPPERPSFACPSGMLPVEGVHYEKVQRLCTDLRGKNCFAFVPGSSRPSPAPRPSACAWTNSSGRTGRAKPPSVMVRFVEAQAICAKEGKRLCSEFEWEMVCEGPDTNPCPHGFVNSAKACNTREPYKTLSEGRLNSSNAEVRDAETKRLWHIRRALPHQSTTKTRPEVVPYRQAAERSPAAGSGPQCG